jgi:pimeloyl-ACP methyl ester carboxylesterase
MPTTHPPRNVRRRGRHAVVVLAAAATISVWPSTPAAQAVPAQAVPAQALPRATPEPAAAPRLAPCDDVLTRARCGVLPRPWDPTGAVPGTIGIGFALVPASDTSRPALGTIAAEEGGPGFPSTGSAAGYAALFAPLLERRNLLLVDQRGTGRSGAIDCPMLTVLVGRYAPAAAACAKRLGRHAHLYGTDLAADDLAAVVRALRLGRIDLYGDSYGTFFAQTFAGRHPDLLRTLTLDSAYPTFGEDAWYSTQGLALRQALATVCRSSPWCRRAGGDPLRRFDALLGRVRRTPIGGIAPGADGTRHRVSIDPATLVVIAYNATYVPTTYRELDAATRSALAGDPLPLLRLAAEVDFPGGGVDPPEIFSEGLDAAVSCRDYPQLFDLTAPPAVRERQLAAAVAREQRTDPRVYAPFTIAEYLASGWGSADWCTQWPVPPAAYRPAPPKPPAGRYAAVPTLVLSGELDTITTPAEGRLVATQFPRSTWVQVAGGLHVTAIGDDLGCVSGIVTTFVDRARVGETSCAGEQPALRTAPPFWRSARDAVPARPARGGTGDPTALRTASVAVATVGDVVARWWQTFETRGLGLRGGSWRVDETGVLTFTLDRYLLTGDVAVSGTVTWDRDSGRVTAMLRTNGSRAVTGRLSTAWDTHRPGAVAAVNGIVAGRRVTATVLAP